MRGRDAQLARLAERVRQPDAAAVSAELASWALPASVRNRLEQRVLALQARLRHMPSEESLLLALASCWVLAEHEP